MFDLPAVRKGGALLAIACSCGLAASPVVASAPHARSSALGAKVARGVTYAGSTSAKDPIVIVLSRDGKAVTRIGTSFEVKCTSGKFLASLLDAQAKLPLGATGSFSSKQTATGDLGNGATARRTVTLKGVVKGRQLTGSAHVHHDVLDAAGAVTDTCDETSTFKATSSAGKVFGGTTSQHGPVVIELTADGKKVHHFHIGWQSTCTPSGFFQVGGTLLNFRIQNGSFGADFSQDFPEPTGEKETDSYSVSGKIKRAKATGTFRVKTTDADPTGATTSSCDTGPITYKTSSG